MEATMKVLIIGGTGLISTAITRFLVERGEDVTIYNRGKQDADIPEDVKKILGDRKDYPAFEAQMKEAGHFDCVIEMIGFMPEEVESDVRAFKSRTGQFIFCSTIDVYTKPAKCYPLIEDAERQPSSTFPYAFNKAKCERILEEAQKRGDFPVTVIRPAHTYGEGRGLVHPFAGGNHFFDRIRKGKPIIVHGDGSSLWVACHRDDVGRAFTEAVGNEKTYGKAYHVTSEEWMTWDQYHQGIAEAMSAPPLKIIHIPTDLLMKLFPKTAEWCAENFQFNNIFDNTAAHADLNFHYTIKWIEGVKRVVDWLDAYRQIENSDNHPFYDRVISTWERLGENMAKELSGLS
jgi:nucleoside-diphosphate-sugar epimerase